MHSKNPEEKGTSAPQAHPSATESALVIWVFSVVVANLMPHFATEILILVKLLASLQATGYNMQCLIAVPSDH